MTRPPGVPDPRNPDAPTRSDDQNEDRNRSIVSLADFLRHPAILAWAKQPITFEPLTLPNIPPERMRELRRRRDAILEQIRERGGLDGRE